MNIFKDEKITTDNLKIITELHKDKYVLKFITKYNKKLYPHPIREEINICLDDYKNELANEINEMEFSFEKDYTIQQENAIKKQFILSATDVLLNNYDDLAFSEIEKDENTGRVLSKVSGIVTCGTAKLNVSMFQIVEPNGYFELSLIFPKSNIHKIIATHYKYKIIHKYRLIPYDLYFPWNY